MKDVLKALERNEPVNVMFHGKIKGTLRSKEKLSSKKVMEHEFFNMKPEGKSTEEIMDELRGGRHRDL